MDSTSNLTSVTHVAWVRLKKFNYGQNDLPERGVNRFADRRIWLKKSKRITDFCDKLNGLADFENRADHGSARNFGLDSGLYLF